MRFVSSLIADDLVGISRGVVFMDVVLHVYAVFRQQKHRLALIRGQLDGMNAQEGMRCGSKRGVRAKKSPLLKKKLVGEAVNGYKRSSARL